MTNNVDFLSLVREEFLARGIPNGDKVSFCKVKKELSKENFAGDFLDSLIDDGDLPKGEAKVWWLPINAQRFPKVCAAMTGNQAGYYAIRKCQEQEWDFLQDWKCVLVNLEMEM